MSNIIKHQAQSILASYHDEGSIFLKSEEVEAICKGRRADPLGTKKTYGDKEYIKTAKGWKPVGKHSGAAKQAHDFVHGDKTIIGKTKSGKDIHDKFDHESHKDFTAQDHLDASDKHMEVMSNRSTEHTSTYHDEESASHYRAYESKKKEEEKITEKDGVKVGESYHHESFGTVTVTGIEENTGDNSKKIPYLVQFKDAKGKEYDQGVNGFKLSTKSVEEHEESVKKEFERRKAIPHKQHQKVIDELITELEDIDNIKELNETYNKIVERQEAKDLPVDMQKKLDDFVDDLEERLKG